MLTKTKRLLAERITKNKKVLWDWHLEQARKAPPPFYCSIDLRDSGYKVAPVDSNLFPAGFNNICPEDLRAAPPIFRAQCDGILSRLGKNKADRILVIPESHTQNAFYIENLYYLTQIISEAGLEVRVGWFGELPAGVGPSGPVELVSQTEKKIQAYPVAVTGGVLSAGDFVPDVILLNNDFSGGYPKLLDEVSQPVIPSHALGWHSRKKSEHFIYYNQLAGEFAKIIDIDPWLIQIDTEEVNDVNFGEEVGIDRVADVVERMLDRTQKAFDAHKVARKPFIFVKNNAGTYGMGIMVVRSADELRQMNRRTKNKMSMGKNRMPIQSVVVQEGIPTATLVDRLAAEPVIYLLGGELLGGFLRTNSERNEEDNLNSQGMVFRKLCMSDLRKPEEDEFPDEADGEEPGLELVYGSIARISALASGIETLKHPTTEISTSK
jgi:glutamate--cysteine ligase